MRRSGYIRCLLATFLVSSQPDAAYVPSMRYVSTPKARPATAPARITSSASPIAPRPLVAAPRAAAIAMPAMPMLPPVGRTATTTDLTVTPNPASIIAPITLTATVAVVPPATGTPTGLVRFHANGAVIGSAPVAPSGLAVFTTGLAVPGTIDLTASYVGDTTFAPSTSDPVPHVTSPAANSTITVTINP